MASNGVYRCAKSLAAVMSVLLLSGAAAAPAATTIQAFPNFNPDGETGWNVDRLLGDDFLPPDRGPGPVLSDPKHAYVPNQARGQQPQYRVADLTNPILQPWAIAQLKKTNDVVLAGKVPFSARERCWPAGVPAMDIYNLGNAPTRFIQTPKEVVITNELYAQIRHIYLDVPHSKDPKPSWHGESVGHYEGDELVVDTIGLNDRTFVDNYGTPHTKQLHVIERFKMINGGNTLQVLIHVEDPGAFNMPWNAKQTWKRDHTGPIMENPCEPSNEFVFGYDVVPLPHEDGPSF